MNDGDSQKLMMDKARRDNMSLYREFEDLMNGPNPLTQDEVKNLMKRNPIRYGFLSMYLKE